MFPVFHSALFANHDTGTRHPENAGRLTAVVNYLKTCQASSEKEFDWAENIRWVEPSNRGVLDYVNKVHNPDYVAMLEAFSKGEGGYLDSDTVMSPQSYQVALLAVAAWLDGLDWVWQQGKPAFVLARPPGHHAERDRAMGFCLFSNAAIAAHYALDRLDACRVAILDWDVHHGNGTQALIESHSQLAYCSFHQSPAYPGTGKLEETGQFQNVLNLPLPPGSQIADYQALWQQQAKPFLAEFDADLLIVSAGYDANQADPLAGICLQPEDYGWFTQECLSLTPKLLFGLEGGYDYPTLARSVAETIRTVCTVC
ncbi:MAG: histone deacetylase [Cyanobacteria bacterium J06598_1]